MKENYFDNFAKTLLESESTSLENMSISPLGAWVNLVIYAEAFKTDYNLETKEKIEAILKDSIESAYEKLQKIYFETPEFIAFALAYWQKSSLLSIDEAFYEKLFATVRKLKNTAKAATSREIIASKELPTKESIDAWVETNSLGLLKEFPEEITEDVEAILANIIALKLDWDEAYEVMETPVAMSEWAVENILYKENDSQTQIIKEDNNFYAIHSNSKTYHDSMKRVRVYSIVGDASNEQVLYDVLTGFINSPEDREFATIEELESLNSSFLKVVEIAEEPGERDSIRCNIHYPAWDVTYKKDLNELEEFSLVHSFMNTTQAKEILNYQVVKSTYGKDSFEAVALTYGMVTRSALMTPVVEPVRRAIVDVFFHKPIVTITIIENLALRGSWFKKPLFVSRIVKASEPEL